MQFIDLFAGLGGFHIAASQLGLQCVLASEIEPKLQELYKINFGIMPEGDIRLVKIESVPRHDLLCAGFPCQPFSKAGSQMGWEDTTRGTVFYNILEILSSHRPEFVILENVAHFVKHDNGNTYRKVRSSLEALNYDVDSKQLSPHKFGIPQIRERMYMVGRLKEKGGLKDFQWPEECPESTHRTVRDILDTDPPEASKLSQQVIDCLGVWQEFLQMFPKDQELPSFPIWSMEFGATYPYDQDSLFDVDIRKLRKCFGIFGESLEFKTREEIFTKLPNYAKGKLKVFPKWKQRFIKQNREFYTKHKDWIDPWLYKIQQFPPSLQKFEWNCQKEERDIWKYILQFRASGVRVKRPNTSPSLVAMTSTQVPIIGWEKRYMTIKECARLQSLDTLKKLPEGTFARKALGNAVNTEVVKSILRNLLVLHI